jgi:hypothetical protein
MLHILTYRRPNHLSLAFSMSQIAGIDKGNLPGERMCNPTMITTS